MTYKRNLDSAPMVGKTQKTERNVVQGGQRPPKKKTPPPQQVSSEPVTDWQSPNAPVK